MPMVRKSALGFAAALIVALAAPALAEDAWYAWSPKPDKLVPYGKNKPVTRLSAVLARHKSEKRWSEQVILTPRYDVKWIEAQPGDKSPTMYWGDDRVFWVVWGGQIRFTIEGQEPFVASKGFLVQVPYRTVYSMETVGDKPSLRLEVNIAGAHTMYPADEKPVPLDGVNFVKVQINGQGKYEHGNRPYIDFNAVVAGTEKQRRFIADDRAVANIIIGDPKKQQPVTDANRGHFHEESPEFWFILLGKMEYKIGDLPIFIADQGDIVYTPKQTWHRARFAGSDMACRLAMNGYQDLLHDYQAPE